MKKYLFSFFLMCFLLLCMFNTAGASLIVNGSFEEGNFIPGSYNDMSLPVGSTDMTGWTVVNDELAWEHSSNQWNLIPSDGEFFLDLTGYQNPAPFGGVTQDIVTVIGQLYRLSFDLGTNEDYANHSGPISVTASAGSTSQEIIFAPSGSGHQWGTFTLDFIADSTSLPITITGASTAGGYYIGLDNVAVSAVPVPSSILLLSFGIISILGVKNRNNRS